MTVEAELRGRLSALEAQRNRALTDHALEAGALAFVKAEKEQLQARVAELEAQLAEATKPKQEA